MTTFSQVLSIVASDSHELASQSTGRSKCVGNHVCIRALTIQNVLPYDNYVCIRALTDYVCVRALTDYVCIRALTIQNVSPEKKNILSCTATTAVIGYEIRYLDLQVLFHIITILLLLLFTTIYYYYFYSYLPGTMTCRSCSICMV